MRFHPPPVLWLAVSVGSGSAASHLGAPFLPAPVTIALLLLLILTSGRPRRPYLPLAVAALAGAIITSAWEAEQARDCRWGLEEGERLQVVGYPLASSTGIVGFQVEEGLSGSCAKTIRALFPDPEDASLPGGIVSGERLSLSGRWRAGRRPDIARPESGGYLVVREISRTTPAGELLGDAHASDSPRPSLPLIAASIRGRVGRRIRDLFPTHGGLVEALILARKEGLDQELREAFALTGTAHLLAISGFHVGVVAALLLSALRMAGVPRRKAGAAAAFGVWLYVIAIGLPDAATRAAIMFSFIALGRLASRPIAPMGTLSTAFLALLVHDPGSLGRPGFQLSFAGAFGLMVMAKPIERSLSTWTRGRCPSSLTQGAAAGIAATLATLPLVAWHFDRVSVVGIPTTLLAGPLVAAAIPGVFGSLALSVVHPGMAHLLAGGVGLLLSLLTTVVAALSRLPFAAVWVPKSWVIAAGVGAVAGVALISRGERLSRRGRRLVALGSGLAVLIALPGIQRVALRDVVEFAFLDVGQGDAIGIRSPGGRWIMVDVGPRGRGFDAGRDVAVPFFRERGVTRLDALFLTHPDLDHIGGAESLLDALDVETVVDPGVPSSKSAYVELLEAAARSGIPWRAARAGEGVDVDGVQVRILHPDASPGAGDGDFDANETSVVLFIQFGSFEAILTGDAPVEAEEASIHGLATPDIELLKVGHHGSATSTSTAFLTSTRPELAVISVGARNGYGHPHASVVRGLHAIGAQVLRTDRHGTVRVLARRDGRFRVITSRASVWRPSPKSP
ncbi:DNA internalization-related competence protein ComEC/Rec2 [Gemmatimonadota bacterium]